MKKVTLMGAGGKMGVRITANLKDKDYSMASLIPWQSPKPKKFDKRTCTKMLYLMLTFALLV